MHGFFNDLSEVIGKLRLIGDAFQLLVHQELPRGIISPPLGQWGNHPGGDLWVEGIEEEDLVREECVTGAVISMELTVVGGAEGGNQRSHLIGVFIGKGWMGCQ